MRSCPCLVLSIPVLAFIAVPASADGLSHLPMLSDVAAEAVQISPHVPHMGTHWAEPDNLPNGGPIYCVIDGRVVCVEYMFPAAAFSAGTDWTGLLPGFETPPITHMDIEYKPDGSGPVTDPLYQFHIYFADAQVLSQH